MLIMHKAKRRCVRYQFFSNLPVKSSAFKLYQAAGLQRPTKRNMSINYDPHMPMCGPGILVQPVS